MQKSERSVDRQETEDDKLTGVSDSFRGLCGARYLVLSGFSLTQ